MSGLPKWAEKHFSLKCYERGAVCSPPDDDRHGWDFLVELPEIPHPGSAETQPPISKAFVQVKSTTGDKLVANIKLSNMLKACRSPDPWFVFLIVRKRLADDPLVYGVHIWRDIIARSLSAIRFADIEGGALNRRRLSVSFPLESRIDGDIIAWMQKEIEASPLAYGVEKLKLSDTVGYEDGYGVGQISFEADSEEEILRAFLGLGDGVIAKTFSYTHSRFGIADKNPILKAENGKMEITPPPVGTCEIHIRGPVDQPSVVLSGPVYAFSPPGDDKSKQRLRFSAPPLDVVVAPQGQHKLTATVDAPSLYPLEYFEAFARIQEWAQRGSLEMEIWSNGQRMLAGTLSLDTPERKFDGKGLLTMVSTLRRVAGSRAAEVTISLKDLVDVVRDVGLFSQVLKETTMRVEFDIDPDIPNSATSLLYRMGVTVGRWRFDCVVYRKVLEDKTIGDRRRVTAALPVFLAAYAMPDATEQEKARSKNFYDKVLSEMEQTENPLGFDDISAFLAAAKLR